jgi:hypothetical protein
LNEIVQIWQKKIVSIWANIMINLVDGNYFWFVISLAISVRTIWVISVFILFNSSANIVANSAFSRAKSSVVTSRLVPVPFCCSAMTFLLPMELFDELALASS